MVPLPSRQQLIRWAIVKMYYNFGKFLIQLSPVIRSRPIHGVIKILPWLKNVFPPLLFPSLAGPDQGALVGVPCDKVRVFSRNCNKIHFLWNRWGSFNCFQTGLSQLWDFCVPFFLTLQWIIKIKLCIQIEKQLFPDPYFSLGSSVQSLSHVWLFTTPWTAACQASLSITNSRSLLTHVHLVSDAIQPSHPLSYSAPPTFNLSQHRDLFRWVNSSYQVAKVLEFQLQHQSFQWIYRTDLL